MKRVAIFGSTGSIGRSTLDVISRFPDEFKVVALTTNTDIHCLAAQSKRFRPAFAAVAAGSPAGEAQLSGSAGCKKIFFGSKGLVELAGHSQVDIVVMAITGAAALPPLLAAIKAGKHIALANKEALVMSGGLVMDSARKTGALVIPIDSEQSAIWQCLEKQKRRDLRRVYLTASGGPLLKKSISMIKKAGPRQVLCHPRWDMGKKITVDSATMMNKGLELIECMSLFDVGQDLVDVVIHPQAVVHSMVEFNDGVVLAQLSATDMRIPIQYALSYPRRLANDLPRLDFYKLQSLDFERPDIKKFPCLALAYRAARSAGTMPSVLNGANETAVACFLEKRINFGFISECIESVMDKHKNISGPGLDSIMEADSWARRQALAYIERNNR